MAIRITSVKGYYHLDAWILANIIQLGTVKQCLRFLDTQIDPCGRLRDQMIQASRSITANIAEGCSRQQTSLESAMRLLDVARASASELLGDFFFLSLLHNIEPWANDSTAYQKLSSLKLDKTEYGQDWEHGAWLHIQSQREKFSPWMEHARSEVALNSMLILCNREILMIERIIDSTFEKFKNQGGFTENLTGERLQTRMNQASKSSAPSCPKCGKPMIKRLIKKGSKQGSYFWGCGSYPNCDGVRDI